TTEIGAEGEVVRVVNPDDALADRTGLVALDGCGAVGQPGDALRKRKARWTPVHRQRRDAGDAQLALDIDAVGKERRGDHMVAAVVVMKITDNPGGEV